MVWIEEYERAKKSIILRDRLMNRLADSIETGLELLGSTAIEDTLQDHVHETIQSMKEAGIIIWVLTGDKIETAMNIGYSCGLLKQGMTEIIIDDEQSKSLEKLISDSYQVLVNT